MLWIEFGYICNTNCVGVISVTIVSYKCPSCAEPDLKGITFSETKTKV